MGTAEDPVFKILCNDAHKRPSSWEHLQRGFFELLPIESHGVIIVRTSCSRLPVRSGIFCPLVEVVYRPCGLKFVYSMINLVFPGIIVKIKLLAKFGLDSLE